MMAQTTQILFDLGLKGRTALVTGANHGIGAATATTLARAGANVLVSYLSVDLNLGEQEDSEGETGMRHYEEILKVGAQSTLEAIRREGGRAESLESDISDPGVIPLIFDRAEEAYGPVEILVNNANHCEFSHDTILTTSADILDRFYSVNTRGTALMMKEFLLRHTDRGGTWGRIINLSQDCAQVSGELGYSSTKATIEMMTRSVVPHAGPLGVTVNAVAPGPVQTGYIARKEVEELEATLVLRRVGTPQDLANAIVFLCSTKADWITGQVLKVDGGSGYYLK